MMNNLEQVLNQFASSFLSELFLVFSDFNYHFLEEVQSMTAQ